MKDKLSNYNALKVKRERLQREYETLRRDKTVHDFVTGSRIECPHDKRTFYISGIEPAARSHISTVYDEYVKCCDRVMEIENEIDSIDDIEIKEAVIGHYIYRKSWQEIAQGLCVSVEAIKKRVYRYVDDM